MRSRLVLAVSTSLASVLLAMPSSAQSGLPAPRSSPKASTSQAVGLSEVTVVYHRPGAKGRVVWGELVPYGEVWRAGANENTTISFSTPVQIEGRPLPAGTYGLHMTPGPETWTVAFSRNSTSWGSYSYRPEEDALAVVVTPRAAPFQEWMSFDFVPVDEASVLLELRWEKLAVPIRVGVDLVATTLAQTRDVWLRGTARWNPAAWQAAAEWCLERDVNLEEAFAWAGEAVLLQKNFATLTLQARLAERLGRTDEAARLNQEAWTVASEEDLTKMGGQLVAARRYTEAVQVFRLAVANNPGSWKAHDHLGQACLKAGDAAQARVAWGRALELAVDQAIRRRLQDSLASLDDKS